MATNKRERIIIEDEDVLGRPHTPYEKRILKMREYRAKNKEKIKNYRLEYYKNNRDTLREYSRKYMKERFDNDPILRQKQNEICKQNYRLKDTQPTIEEIEKKAQIKENKKQLRRLLKQQALNEQAIKEREQLENDIKELQSFIQNI